MATRRKVSSPKPTAAKRAQGQRVERSAERTKERILSTAKSEFCKHGLSGARVERIARDSKSNMRMIYHHFGNKKLLYVAVLEAVYSEIRAKERELNLTDADPVEGMKRLIHFTFDFFLKHKDYLALIGNENMLRAQYLKQVDDVHEMTTPLISSIRHLLDRGKRERKLRSDVDPIQLYVSIVALSQLHIMSRFTLSVIFDRNLEDKDWIAERRVHIMDLLLDHLTRGCAERA